MPDGSETKSDFGNLLRIARERAGISRQKLGEMVGLDSSHIYRIETGGRRPSRESALALADALGLKDDAMNEWLLAAGYAPMPLLTAIRAAVRVRGAVRTRSSGRSDLSHWDPAVWAKRLDSVGLREAVIERLLSAMASASLAEQGQAGKALSAAFDNIAETLESPIHTAVIPAAGGKQRLLAPHIIQRLLLKAITEAAAAGISKVILVLAPESAESLFIPLREALEITLIPQIDLSCVQQLRPEGLGAAIAEAVGLAGRRPFAVLLPDDVVRERAGRTYGRELRHMIDSWKQLPDANLIAVTSIPRTKMPDSGVVRLAGKSTLPQVYLASQIIEKPEYSDPICSEKRVFGIVGRYVLQPSVFDAVLELKERAKDRNPIELTEAMELLRRRGSPIYGYEITAHRHDLGDVVKQAGKLIG
jgi:UTP--glucose-1-phosphate uridylyltransferase